METVYISLSRNLNDPENPDGQKPSKETLSLLQFAVRLCRKHSFIKDRVTVLSPSDFLQILQLCHARRQKEIGKGFQADNATVFTLAESVCVLKLKAAVGEACGILNRILQADKYGSAESEAVDHENILNQTPPRSSQQPCGENEAENEIESLSASILKDYQDLIGSSNHSDVVDVLRIFLVELLSPQSELHADLTSLKIESVDSPQDPMQELILELLTSRSRSETNTLNADLIHRCLAICAKDSSMFKTFSFQSQEQTEGNSDLGQNVELVQELFHSYLHLLVNTRSELAFAHVFNTPDRGLTHQAFTHLKHQAQKKNMSLYQTAMSVIVQIRLGGRGYAPDPNSGLLEHVKGLGLLSDLMNKLQELLEDTQCVRTSVKRVVGVIRKNLVACKSQRYKKETVESVVVELQKDLEHVLTELQMNSTLISPDKPASQGGSLTSRRPRRVLLHYLDRYAVSVWGARQSAHHTWMHDVPYGPHTPTCFPCVLSQFRSPAVDDSLDGNNKVQKETKQKKRMMIVSTNLMPDDVDQPLLQRCSKRLSDTVIVLPSKTIVHPAESRTLIEPRETGDSAKENLKPGTSPVKKKRKKAANSNNPHTTSTSAAPLRVALRDSGSKKKGVENSSTQPCKQAPKPGKKCRRRLLSPVKGQQSITSFFRV